MRSPVRLVEENALKLGDARVGIDSLNRLADIINLFEFRFYKIRFILIFFKRFDRFLN